MGDTIGLLNKDGAAQSMSVDALSTRDGASAGASEKVQVVKVGWGAEDDLQSTSDTRPMPVRESKFTSVLQRSSAVTSSSTSQTLLASNSSRRKVYVSNQGASGIFLDFGTAAVAGNGVYLPSKAKDTYETDMQVTVILESGGSAGPVSALGV